LEGTGHDLIDVLSQHFPGGLRKTTINLRIIDVCGLLRQHVTSWKGAGLIPDEVIGFFN
jgi:hypothetical protein